MNERAYLAQMMAQQPQMFQQQPQQLQVPPMDAGGGQGMNPLMNALMQRKMARQQMPGRTDAMAAPSAIPGGVGNLNIGF